MGSTARVDDPGHLGDDEPRTAYGVRICAALSVSLAVVALVLAFVPAASFFAGLPALAALVLGVIAVVAGARRVLPAIGTVVAVVALTAATVVSAQPSVAGLRRLGAGPSEAPTAAATSDASGRGRTDALAAGAHRVVYEVLGSGTASISYTAFVGGASGASSEDTVAVPHRRAQRVTLTAEGGPARFSMVALPGNPGDEVGCRISIDGRAIAQRASATGSAAACIAVAD